MRSSILLSQKIKMRNPRDNMRSILLISALICALVPVAFGDSSSTPPETCRRAANDIFSLTLRDDNPLKVLLEELVEPSIDPDGFEGLKNFMRRTLNKIKELRTETTTWRSFYDNVFSVRRGLQLVCRNYQHNRQRFPFKCYPKENWCILNELFTAIQEQLETVWKPVGGELDLTPHPPFGGFPPPGNDDSRNTLITELKMACETFFHHPLLGEMASRARDNGLNLKQRIINRVTYYIEVGEIENINFFIARFNWVKQPFSDASDSEEDSLVHDISLLLGSMLEISRDMDSYDWDYRWPAPLLRSEIAMLWLILPKWNHNLFSKYDDEIAQVRVKSFLQESYDAVQEKNSDNLQLILDHTQHLKRKITNDCRHHSPGDSSSLECDISRALEGINRLVEEYKKSDWHNVKVLDSRSAAFVYFLSTALNKYITVSPSHSRETILDILSRLYAYSKEHDNSVLENYVSLMPTMESTGTEQSCSEFYGNLQSRLPCILTRILRQVTLYINSLKVPSSKTKILSTRHDPQRRIESEQLSSLFDHIDQRALEAKANLADTVYDLQQFVSEETDRRFHALASYFRGIASFDQSKANADIGFLQGRLKSFDDDIREIQPTLERKMIIIISSAFKSSHSDALQRGIEAVFKVITACNAADGEIDFGAFFDTANDISQSITSTSRASALVNNYREAFRQTSSVASRLSENNAFIRSVREIVEDLPQLMGSSELFSTTTSRFLQSYSDYDPKVKREEISLVATNWETFLGEACDVIFSGGTAASSAEQNIVANKGDCLLTQGQISKLIEIFCEIYDYQTELMETLASAVRAYQSQYFANGLDTRIQVLRREDFSSTNENGAVSLHQTVLSSYLANRLYTQEIVIQHCNYLQFKNADELPPECQSALRTLGHRDISKIQSLQPGRCRPEVFKYVEIPVKKPEGTTNALSWINMTRLYKGEEVPFKVPNFEWLEENGWIVGASQGDTAIYISAFEIFLPSMLSSEERKRKNRFSYEKKKGSYLGNTDKLSLNKRSTTEIGLQSNVSRSRISAKSSGVEREVHFAITAKYPAPLFPGENAIKYSLQPYVTYAFGYKENAGSCRLDTIGNPYSSSLPKLCQLSSPPENPLSPSIFSLWIVKLENPPNSVPENVGNEKLKAAIRICKVKKPSVLSKAKSKKKKTKKMKKERKEH